MHGVEPNIIRRSSAWNGRRSNDSDSATKLISPIVAVSC
ncbi:MAG TPA: hypothetical protein [Caudoviricetes sp.]|nr:MAG TPA: hypothetical protein [Caudoviricetes sp.]